MSIPKLNSQDLNRIYEDAKNNLKDINAKFDITKKDIEAKLKIMTYESEYMNNKIESINNGSLAPNYKMTAFYNNNGTRFTKYGNVVHSKLVKEPINVFNLNMSGLGEKFFREDVSVYINNETNSTYTSILKDESINDKEIYFNLFNTNTLTLSVQVNDFTSILGSTKTNCIEIDPFLPGSFDISNIRIYAFESDGSVNIEEAPYIINTINNVGKTRLVLSKKINFYKIDFDIVLNYQTQRNTSIVYPFGLKHLFFYDMDFSTDSYIVAEINTANNISYIKNEISLVSPYGKIESTISAENILLYLYNIDGELSYQIEPSISSDITEIAKDVKTIYAKIPLSTSSVLKGIVFNPVERNI